MSEESSKRLNVQRPVWLQLLLIIVFTSVCADNDYKIILEGLFLCFNQHFKEAYFGSTTVPHQVMLQFSIHSQA